MKIAARLSLLLAAVGLCACIDIGAGQIEVPLSVAGTQIDGPITGKDGAQIELDRAELAFGPIYLCAGFQAGSLCETARLEWLDSIVVDVLDPAAVEAGELSGREGFVRSWMFDLGVVSLLTKQKHLLMPAAEELGGASLQLAGTAVVDEVTIPFTLALVVAQEEQTEIGVSVMRKSSTDSFGHEVTGEEPGLLVRFDAAPYVTQIDFAGLLEDRACAAAAEPTPIVCAGQTEQRCDPDGSLSSTRDCAALDQVCVRALGCVAVVEFSEGSQGYRAVRNQVVAGPRPTFAWGHSP